MVTAVARGSPAIGTIKRVAVIGAGASGLTAIKELLRQGFEVTAFEGRSQVGGAWIRSPSPPGECIVSFDKDGRPFPQTKRQKLTRDYPTVLDPTPMYQLRTNIPCNQMAYRDTPFKEVSNKFPTDQEVLDYLEDFAQGIKDRIRFQTLVKRIYKDTTEGDSRWIVESVHAEKAYSASNPPSMRDYFDAICDCSGHYYEPSIPYVKGLWRYKKKILHGKWYRGPEAYTGQNVLVVGNSSSGYDMSREIALLFKSQGSDKRVYQSMRHKVEVGIDPSENPEWASHLEVVAPLDHATEDEIVLADGRRLNVDVVMFGTGYLYSFPYYRDSDQPFEGHPLTKTLPLPVACETPDDLDHDAAFPVGGVRVHNLDEQYQTFYYPDPTLAFIALGKQIIPFPLAQSQAHAVAKYWSGTRFPLRPSSDPEESPAFHKYGAPKEFDLQDALLNAVGEGQCMPEQPTEVTEDGAFPAVAGWRRQQRPFCKQLRRETLGY